MINSSIQMRLFSGKYVVIFDKLIFAVAPDRMEKKRMPQNN
jgi:hypothetical protein